MSRDALETYLRREIPLTVPMGLAVVEASPTRVVLSAALAPNTNHQRTAFGGSVAAIATLAAWSLLHLRCRARGKATDLVIQRSEMDYIRPIRETLRAVCDFEDEALWEGTLERLERRGRARIEIQSRLEVADGADAARFRGRFALMERAGADRGAPGSTA